MSSSTMAMLIAAVGGMAVAIQAQFMGLMDRSVGNIEGVFITYCGGGILIAGLMLLMRGGNLGEWRSVPWYAFTSGILGLVIVGSIGFSVPRLGLVASLTILVAIQLLVGAVLDHFGLLGAVPRPLDLPRILGMAVLVVGIWLTIR
ncbi:MAG: DMT family transporter [Deltaproteobacteria bacterium]|nr:DMT family transporter [Deltaproteobacteria bacterium]MBW2298388.1 DMT family transporter [Deltaproteobacteria bacterium]